MQSSSPIPGNPWPHEMLITVEDDPHALLELLWIREAWGLRPIGNDLPPLLSDDSVQLQSRTISPDRLAAWQAAWPTIWDVCIHDVGLIRDPTLFEKLRETTDGSPERAQLLHELRGPSWRDEFGNEAFTDEYEVWTLSRFEARSRREHRTLDEEPERVSLAALIPAWRSGLSKIVTIPCRGSYVRIIGPHTLLVTDETRDDPHSYSDALTQFR
jgi:hypothetical protein